MKSIAVLWAQYGPYHFARFEALQKLMEPVQTHALELSNKTSFYEWNRANPSVEVTALCPGQVAESLSFRQVFQRARQTLAQKQVEVCFLPGYAPKESLAALLAAKSLGIRTVMMNESHEGTARAKGLATLVKRRLVGLFDAALVGGQPQRRYFSALGMPQKKILLGYDAVDNEHFARKSEGVKSEGAKFRIEYGLPDHYFLSLGRFISKKNLGTLIEAFRKFLDSSPRQETHLVLVGSGEEEAALRAKCVELQLPVYDKADTSQKPHEAKTKNEPPGVHFYGFRQVDENPVFYGLADAFILPSLWEEWGLVVNEAMASGLPVIVSATAGCAEDLLETGVLSDESPIGSGRSLNGSGLEGRIRQNGFVFDPGSSTELARMMSLLATLPDLRLKMGQASRRIIGKFSCQNFARNALLAAQAAMNGM